MNPGPHGPEPCWLCVPEYPVGSACARLNSHCRAFVSVCVLPEPSDSRNLCPVCAPSGAPKDGGPATTSHREVALQGQALTLFSPLTLWAAVDSNHLPPQ